VVLGGGVQVKSGGLGEDVNTSSPLGGTSTTAWQAYVNNTTGSSADYIVTAQCAKAPKGYKIVSSPGVDNPAGTQTRNVLVTCPAGTKVLGGGGVLESADPAVNLNDSFPVKVKVGRVTHYGWRIDANNASSQDNIGAISYAVCGNVSGYRLVQGAAVTNPALSDTFVGVTCPFVNGVAEVAVGGGVVSNSGSTFTNIESTFADAGSWVNYENNGSIGSAEITPLVTCAL
jgi:hypothetical protein